MKKIKLLDTFSGIGGFSYAAEKLVGGFETTQFVENDSYCQKILNKHWPKVPIHDDIRTFTAEPFQYDVVCGGFPCQDISTAGRGKGITEETRSGLFFELMRVIRMVRPKYVVMENVAAILNNGMDIVLAELSEAGFDAEWAIIPASSVGACHKRSRWWLVAYTKSQSSNGSKFESSVNKKSSISKLGNSCVTITNTDNNGLSSAEECKLHDKASDRTQKREEKSSQLEGSSEPSNCRFIQSSSEFTNSYSQGVERRKFAINEKMQKTGFTWQSNTPHLSPEWRSYVSKPVLCRGDDGLRNRVDRLKSLGNSVVPQCAAIPLQRVKDLFYDDI
jgi:DNA (cytosine-5)-methyltransferase 1